MSKWILMMVQLIVTDPVGFGLKITRLAMLVVGVLGVVLSKMGHPIMVEEGMVQEIVSGVIAMVAMIWSFGHDVKLKQSPALAPIILPVPTVPS